MQVKTNKNLKNHYYFLISLLSFLTLFFISPPPITVLARNFSPYALPVGSIVKMGDRTLIKVTEAGKFIDLENYGKTMQGWNGCASLPTPTGKNFTQGPILTDIRDDKKYEIRKFSDGKCWMVDNLMYGGETIDACDGKSTFNGNGSATSSNRFGPGTYGDCRDPRVGGSAPCIPGSTVCGYYYNWQGAMQHPTAYYNTTYTGPTTNVQGICPDGWRLPTGGTSGDFTTLHSSAGSPTTGFWQIPGNWQGSFSGFCNSTGGLSYQNVYSLWWSSTPRSATTVNAMQLESSAVYPSVGNYKYDGYNIRCIKD